MTPKRPMLALLPFVCALSLGHSPSAFGQLGACCACGCPGEEATCQETTLEDCASVEGCTGFSGTWRIYSRCDTDGNGTGDGDKCSVNADCDSSPGAGDGVCTVPEGGQCGINPCGGEPVNDDCENAIAMTHPDNDENNDIVVCNDIRCATTDGPMTNCAIGGGDLSFGVWYRYTPPPDKCGTLTIQTCNSLPVYDGFAAAYLASHFAPGNECAEIVVSAFSDVGCSDDNCGIPGPWQMQVEIPPNDELYIRMGGWYDGDPSNYAGAVGEGCFELHLDPNVGITCEPSVFPPMPAPFPHDRRKNRYISFDPFKSWNDAANIAFKVELKQITLGSCDGATGGSVDFCRTDRKKCSISGSLCASDAQCGATEGTCVAAPELDCNACSTSGNACVNRPIDCLPGETCDSTGETCANDAPDVGGSNIGRVWWVGPEHPSGNGVHLLVSEPFRKVSTNWPNPTHVGDCEIVPQAVYGMRGVNVETTVESDELEVETTLFATLSSSWWGDCVGNLGRFCDGDIRKPRCNVVGDCPTGATTCARAWTLPDGVAGFDDIGAAVALIAPRPTSVLPHMTWVDLHGNDSGTPGSQAFDPPNYVANFSDIQQILSGFQGRPYTFYDPADCPDEPDWP